MACDFEPRQQECLKASRKKLELELMRQIDEVTSQQHELSETLKQHLARISAILEEPEVMSQQVAGAVTAPVDLAPEEEAEWWRERIAKLSEAAPPLGEPDCVLASVACSLEDSERSTEDACMVIRPPKSPCTPSPGRGRRVSGRSFVPLAAASMLEIDKRESQCSRDKSLDRMTEVPSC